MGLANMSESEEFARLRLTRRGDRGVEGDSGIIMVELLFILLCCMEPLQFYEEFTLRIRWTKVSKESKERIFY